MQLFTGRTNRLSYFISGLIYGTYFSFIYEPNFRFIPPAIIDIISFLFIIFLLSVITKRNHDINKSGWYSILLFIPFVNIYWGLKLLLGVGDFQANKYGESPKSGIKLQ